jgi:hypothetical protein
LDFISEEDLQTFEGWLNYQGIDPSTTESEDLAIWRREFEEASQRHELRRIVGVMKLRQVPGEYRYAVAERDGANLFLTLWVRRSVKGDVFVLVPRGDRSWNPHTSYHRDGTVHVKSYDYKLGTPQKRQPLTDSFRGMEHLGVHFGHGPKSVGAVCEPATWSGIIEVPPGVLGPRNGGIAVDLVEPGHEPVDLHPRTVVIERAFQDIVPWIVIRVVR